MIISIKWRQNSAKVGARKKMGSVQNNIHVYEMFVPRCCLAIAALFISIIAAFSHGFVRLDINIYLVQLYTIYTHSPTLTSCLLSDNETSVGI